MPTGPADVGLAIAAYLVRGRPASRHRQIFLRATPPAGPLSRTEISNIVRRACARAGLPQIGAHRLRHTAACQRDAAARDRPGAAPKEPGIHGQLRTPT